MPPIHVKTQLYTIGSSTLLSLPKSASTKLSSRGMVMVAGTLNGFPFLAPLEPDGKGSHYLEVSKALAKKASLQDGDTIELAFESVDVWPEPKIPTDLKKALQASPQAHKIWMDTTPIARWDWIRWIRSTKQAQTRQIRIEKTCSKLQSGMKRPCCFNRSQCTDPSVSKSGVLLDPREE